MTSNNMTPEQAARLSLAEQHEWFRRATSRRAMLRGGLVGAGALVAGPSLMSPAASASTAASTLNSASLLAKADYVSGAAVVPFGRHLMYGADPTTQMSISWQVPTPVTNPFARVGTSPLDLGERIPAELRVLSTPRTDISAADSVSPHAPSTVEQYYLHATVSHLMPGRTYYYSVGHNHWDPQGGDLLTNVRSFTTAPGTRGAFTFTAFGDQGISYDAVGTANLVRAQKPAFHLHAGDIAYADETGHGLVTDSYDPGQWDLFLTQVESVASSLPWQVNFGNHEMEAWYSPDGYGGHYARFSMPVNDRSYYSFTYGNVAVLSLDGNDVSYELPANNGYSGGSQLTWLANQLAAFRKRPGIDFIVAYFHNCAYCTASAHASDGGVREKFVPLFDRYSVDLVINGHNHVYERTDPMRGGAVTASAPSGSTVTPATQGTTYITAGAAGNSLYSFTAADSYEGSVDNVANISSYYTDSTQTKVGETINWSRVRYTGYSLLRVDSTPAKRGGASTLTVRGLAEDGTEVDAVTLSRTAT